MEGINNLQRSRLYAMLRDALFAYSEKLHSVDVEVFAVEMELDTQRERSADPALLDEFNKAFPETVGASAALMLAADYIEHELVDLRHVAVAKDIVREFRLAACSPEMQTEILKDWT